MLESVWHVNFVGLNQYVFVYHDVSRFWRAENSNKLLSKKEHLWRHLIALLLLSLNRLNLSFDHMHLNINMPKI